MEKVNNRVVSDEIEYISAIDEEEKVIAQANAPLDKKNRFTEDLVPVRHNNEFELMSPDKVTHLGHISSASRLGCESKLYRFLEHDDANEAPMGSNMQRRLFLYCDPEKPLVGTGLETAVARDSGVCVVAKNKGIVESVDAGRIVVRVTDAKNKTLQVDIYNLVKYTRSNQNTCINQRPIVKRRQSYGGRYSC